MEKYAITAGKGIAALAIALSTTYASPTFTQETNPQAETKVKNEKETANKNTKDNGNNEGKKDKKDSLAELEKRINEVKVNEGGNWESYSETGRQLITGSLYTDAIAFSRKAHALNEAASEPLVNIGIAYVEYARDKPFDERKALCEKAIPLLKQALKNKAKEEKEDTKKEEEIRKNNRVHYTKSDINAWIGLAHHSKGDLEKAVEFYRKAPESMLSVYGLANIENMH